MRIFMVDKGQSDLCFKFNCYDIRHIKNGNPIDIRESIENVPQTAELSCIVILYSSFVITLTATYLYLPSIIVGVL